MSTSSIAKRQSPARDIVELGLRHVAWLALVGALVFVFLLYGRAITFAFFFDDTYDLTRVEGRSYWSLLSSSAGYQYYRPIPFLIWKFLRDLQGYYSEALLHSLVLIVHAVTGWLLYLLLRRLGSGEWALIPMVLFLSYPFHYQVVPIVGTIFHPLAGMAILATLNLYLMGQSAAPVPRRWLMVASVGTTVFALWSHESGVAVAPLLVMLEAALVWRQRRRRPSWWISPHLIVTCIFVVAWLAVEKLPSSEQTSLAELRPKLLFFLQGFTYPFSAQIGVVRDRLGVSLGILEVGMLAFLAVGTAYVVAAQRAARAQLLLIPMTSVAIAIAAFLPALTRLSWGYVQEGPRLLYLAAIGSAIFWGMSPSLSFKQRTTTITWRIVTICLVVVVVIQSWRFIDIRMDMFASGTAMIDDIVTIGETRPGHPLLIVNAPSWFALNQYEYPYGHYGVQLMPTYIGLDRVIYTSARRPTQVDVRSGA